MPGPSIPALLAAFNAVLVAEEALLDLALQGPAHNIRCIIETLRETLRNAVEAATAAPGDAFERVNLLRHAVDLEGADSPLVARIASTLAASAK